MNRYAAGALAGLVATLPMTAVMVALRAALPRREQYALPPREITLEVADKAGIEPERLPESARHAATTVAHYGFGAAAGAAYVQFAERFLPQGGSPALKGIAWGLTVWTSTYLGVLPAADILRPATEHPARRNALMIAAHVVWGGVTGVLTERLTGDQD